MDKWKKFCTVVIHLGINCSFVLTQIIGDDSIGRMQSTSWERFVKNTQMEEDGGIQSTMFNDQKYDSLQYQ